MRVPKPVSVFAALLVTCVLSGVLGASMARGSEDGVVFISTEPTSEPLPSQLQQALADPNLKTVEVKVVPSKLLGAQASLGLPSGAGVKVLVRPLRWLRLHGGVAHNGLGASVQGGLTLDPLLTPVRVVLGGEVGHQFEGNANRVVQFFVKDPFLEIVTLEHFSYDYATGYLGLELGSPNGLSFYLHGGITGFRTELRGFEEDLQRFAKDPNITSANPRVTATLPTAELGLLYFFW